MLDAQKLVHPRLFHRDAPVFDDGHAVYLFAELRVDLPEVLQVAGRRIRVELREVYGGHQMHMLRAEHRGEVAELLDGTHPKDYEREVLVLHVAGREAFVQLVQHVYRVDFRARHVLGPARVLEAHHERREPRILAPHDGLGEILRARHVHRRAKAILQQRARRVLVEVLRIPDELEVRIVSVMSHVSNPFAAATCVCRRASCRVRRHRRPLSVRTRDAICPRPPPGLPRPPRTRIRGRRR